eukprot:365228-Chlamydomonas_euryale.AAC.16
MEVQQYKQPQLCMHQNKAVSCARRCSNTENLHEALQDMMQHWTIMGMQCGLAGRQSLLLASNLRVIVLDPGLSPPTILTLTLSVD